jgi:hypothetical protein
MLVAMERAAWTDERLDDLAESIRTGFDRNDRDLRDLRSEMNTRFLSLDTGLRAEIDGLRQTVLRVGAALVGGMMVGFLSVIAAVLIAA